MNGAKRGFSIKATSMLRRAALAAVLAMAVETVTSCQNPFNSTPQEEAAHEGHEEIQLEFWNVGLDGSTDNTKDVSADSALYRYVDKFEKENPGVVVHVVNLQADQITTLLKAARASKKGPDLIGQRAGGATNDFQDILTPLDRYLTAEEKGSYRGLDIGRVNFQPNGRIQALPYNITTYNIFYNKAVFAKAGFMKTPVIKTWNDFLALCAELKAKGIMPLFVGEQEGYTAAWMTSEFMLDMLGPKGLSKLYAQGLKFSSPSFKQAIRTWKQVYDDKYTNPDYVTLSSEEAMRKFGDSGAAMTINGSWTINDLISQLGGNLGTMQIPAISKNAPFGDYLVSQPGANISVSVFTKHTDLAVKFVEFITSGEFQMEYYKDTGDIPANTKADLTKIDNAITQESLSWINKGWTSLGFDTLIPGEASSEFYRLASAVLYGRVSVDELASSIDSKIKP
ncbi:ABC transporter substrate-binding protein [Paenibacillus sp. R14(2021)]|uniref:ABC transporter substrate-binding protein n=1 Tax=Paenibacillus sp. R14(2021) TaxID=2859228 RepID=UPI001C6155F0|nr:extracellular solute-binding protein [Paenibacillus sp. R14(2021)]